MLEADRLRDLLLESSGPDSGCVRQVPVVVVDCRTFTAFNAAHVDGAVNVHCPPIVRRRAGGRIPAANVVRSAEVLSDLTAGRCRAVVLYDESSQSVDELDAESNARLSLSSLSAVLPPSTPLCLLKGLSVCPPL